MRLARQPVVDVSMGKEDTMTTLDSQIAAYETMRDVLETDHFGQWVIFNGGQLIGTDESFQDAAEDVVRRFGRGPYLIRQMGGSPMRLTPTIRRLPVAARYGEVVQITQELRQTYS